MHKKLQLESLQFYTSPILVTCFCNYLLTRIEYVVTFPDSWLCASNNVVLLIESLIRFQYRSMTILR